MTAKAFMGGHVLSALTVAQGMQKRSHNVIFVLLLQNYGMHVCYKNNLLDTRIPETTGCQFPLPNEYQSLRMIFSRLVKDFFKAFKNTSIQKELKWLKCRINNF